MELVIISFIRETEIVKKEGKLMKFLIGPWNTEASFEFAVGHLKLGQKSPYHFHTKIEEVVYVISGILEVNIEGKITEMPSETAAFIKPGLKHSIIAKTDVYLVEVKNPSDEFDKHVIE
ncbi:MAG: cupin domain-containing protein [Candidatus Lokiarchaeota archaeon]|nr:cupin domain-containing protein [Candidatus Lokiarchaeota archaeon]